MALRFYKPLLPNPPAPFPAREGGAINILKSLRDFILGIFLPSPCRRGVGGEVTQESVSRMKQPWSTGGVCSKHLGISYKL